MPPFVGIEVNVTFVPEQTEPDGLAEIITPTLTLEVIVTTTVSLFCIPDKACVDVSVYEVVLEGEATGLLIVLDDKPETGDHE